MADDRRVRHGTLTGIPYCSLRASVGARVSRGVTTTPASRGRASRETRGVPIRFPIKTPRLIIRPMHLNDAGALLAVYGDIETMQYLSSDLPTNVAEAREWVQTKIDLFARDGQLSLWTVVHTESGQIVGDVGLQHEDYGSGPVVGLGGRGNRQFWRQGLGFEAANATIAAGFEELDLEAIGAETRPRNLPAQALLAKLGMQPSGTNTQGWPVYMITREEWLAHNSQNPVAH